MADLTRPGQERRLASVILHLASEEPTPESRADDDAADHGAAPEGYPHRDTMPRAALLHGRRVRVVGYPRRDHFEVVDTNDARTVVHRDALIFLPAPSASRSDSPQLELDLD